MEAALYDPEDGFFQRVGSAGGHGGDFVTSPEIGPLFGAVLARALDQWWQEAGCPDPYVVVDAGAGAGTLARAMLLARPACSRTLRLVLVERAAAQRHRHPEGAERRVDLPERAHVVVANELLDNLPFDIVQAANGRWHEVRVGLGRGGKSFEEVAGPVVAGPVVAGPFEDPASLRRLPWPRRAAAWVSDARGRCERLVAVDYMASAATIGPDWLRTYRAHRRGHDPLVEPGTCDITADVLLDALPTPDAVTTQAEFLQRHGIEELVAEGRRVWHQRASAGDLAAMAGRSRVREAEALLDPTGFGGFMVAEWRGTLA